MTDLNFPPSKMPDLIILNLKCDPNSSQAITWRTDTTITEGRVRYTRADTEINAQIRSFDTTAVQEKKALTSLFRLHHLAAHYHACHLENLQPGTIYAYQIGNGKIWSEWLHFRTAPVEPQPFSFLYFGDMQLQIKSMGSRVIRQAY